MNEGRDFSLVRQRQDDLEQLYIAVARDKRSFFARPYVDSHIRTSLAELRQRYLQLYQVEDKSPDRDWLKEIAESLDQFTTTFATRSRVLPLGSAAVSLKGFMQYPAVVWFLGLTGLGSWLAERAGQCACEIIGLASYLAVGWILLSMVGGFRKKRRAFLLHDVYSGEDALIRMVGGKPPRELQMDVLGLALIGVVFAIAALLDQWIGTVLDGMQRATIHWVLAAISLLGAALVGVASTRRDWAWGRRASRETAD